MADIIKSIAGDFNNGVDLAKLHAELEALVLSVTFNNLRTDGDVLTMTFSGSLSGGDSSAIDTAVDDHDPTVLTAEAAASQQLEIFGQAYAYEEQESISVRLTEDWSQILCLDVPALEEDGDYRIGWYYEWAADTTREDFIARVRVDDSVEIGTHRQEPKDSGGSSSGGSGTNQRHVACGFKVMSFSAGDTPSIDLDVVGQDDDYELTAYRVRFEFWRVR